MTAGLPRPLSRRRFESRDQALFVELSGDENPIHTDPIAARRTIMGAPVVHGVHLALRAIEALRANHFYARGNNLISIGARFPRPTYLGDVVEFRLSEAAKGRCRIESYVQQNLVLDLELIFGPGTGRNDARLAKLKPLRLQEQEFHELEGLSGALSVGVDARLARKQFPGLVVDLGLLGLAELLALTRLVGMRCPGRHSLFSQFDVAFDRHAKPGRMHFRVERTDTRFLRVDMTVEGARLGGKLTAFFRPAPQAQPTIAAVAACVARDEFRSSVALIVGGSRGLGETTAKIIAAGGGRPIVTYNSGKEDAAAVVREIRKWGGRCDALTLDVRRLGDKIERIFSRRTAPRTIYYFATPQIFAKRRDFFSRDLLQRFIDYYVGAFTAIIDAAASRSGVKLNIFYPSTVAVTEAPRELAEYAMAKRLAEEVCAFYNAHSDKIKIVVERLPRIKTDQTAVLFEIPAETSLSVMLPIVRRVELG